MADDILAASTPEHFKALAHPTRQRLLFELDRPATISQLAVTLDTHKGNVAHHLGVLRDAGLVAITGTRRVRGGTEQYYERTARMLVATGEDAQSAAPLLVHAVAAEIAAAEPDPFLTVRHLRLTAAQAEAIAATLSRLAADTPEAGDDQPRYGMMLALYQQPPPVPGASGGPAPASR
jgi:DNA-binding transcriptional ArsR family regulator